VGHLGCEQAQLLFQLSELETLVESVDFGWHVDTGNLKL
jgi:hypothetical protein